MGILKNAVQFIMSTIFGTSVVAAKNSGQNLSRPSPVPENNGTNGLPSTGNLAEDLTRCFKAQVPGYSGELKTRFPDRTTEECKADIDAAWRKGREANERANTRKKEIFLKYSKLGIAISGPDAVEPPPNADLKTKYVWISLMEHTTCQICSKNHGKTKTLDAWTKAGEPRSGACVHEELCGCMLFPASLVDSTIQGVIDELHKQFKQNMKQIHTMNECLENDNLETFSKLLESGFPFVYTDNDEKASLLHLAVRRGSPKIAAHLLSINFDPGTVDRMGYSALNYAFDANDPIMVRLLVGKRVPLGNEITSIQLSKRFRSKEDNKNRQQCIAILREHGYL